MGTQCGNSGLCHKHTHTPKVDIHCGNWFEGWFCFRVMVVGQGLRVEDQGTGVNVLVFRVLGNLVYGFGVTVEKPQ